MSDSAIETDALPRTRLRRTFSALRYRDYRLVWFGAFMSTTGTWMQTVAQAWVVYSLTGSALLLGFDAFLSTGPMERRKIMLASQYLQMTFAFVLAYLLWSQTVKIWHIFLLSFLTGSAQSFSGPAYASLLPLLVKREDVPNAIAMNSMQFNLARVIGPVLGGLALTAWGASACFGLNGLSFVAVIIAYLIIRTPIIRGSGETKGIMEEMREGFRFVISRRALLLLTFLSFAGTFLGMPIITFLPVVAKVIFAAGPKAYTYLLSAYGVGSVFGALFVAASGHVPRKGRLALMLQLAFATLLIAFAVSRVFPVSLLIAFGAGACIVGVISLYSSLVQLATNDSMRGRVMSIFMLAFRGGMPLGNLLAGFVAQRWSITVALLMNGVMLAAVALTFILRRTDLDAHIAPAEG
jgi:predicted MFS family arabinose efflux permease